MKKVARRRFLNIGTKFLAFIPVANFIACHSDHKTTLSPENSLKKLIFLIGPWTLENKLIAEDFANRFLLANHVISQYLPKSAKLIQTLSQRFSNETMAIGEINLNNLPKVERDFLVALSKHLYSFVEVRFYVSGEPPWGECQGNAMWQTRTPKRI